ncbi:hypothetical protein MRX96_002045 [Rhipicephalus microplus]
MAALSPHDPGESGDPDKTDLDPADPYAWPPRHLLEDEQVDLCYAQNSAASMDDGRRACDCSGQCHRGLHGGTQVPCW